jgi:hypothetical protein
MLNKIGNLLGLLKVQNKNQAEVSFCDSCGQVCNENCRADSLYREANQLKEQYFPGLR